nr:hypothetical protein [Deltaproteobacteria bacterium]
DDECTDHHSCIEEICDNGNDDDGDGYPDCNDDECTDHHSCINEICDNGNDDDGDGNTDCDDDECAGHHYCIEEICNNGNDDDGDGYIDCNDDECLGQSGGTGICEALETSCDDGFDNDANGLIDCDDPACSTLPVCTNSEICQVAGDEDNDSFADCLDPDCEGQTGPEGQICELTETICSDNFDNDGDGLFDCDDPDCTGLGGICLVEECNNNSDDDGDGDADCNDSDCWWFSACSGEVCNAANPWGYSTECYSNPCTLHPQTSNGFCNTEPGDKTQGEICITTIDCAPGLACAANTHRCRRLCTNEPGVPSSCPSDTYCAIFGSGGHYGFCTEY